MASGAAECGSVATGTPAGTVVAGTVVDPPPRSTDSFYAVQLRLVSESGSASLFDLPLDESETVAELKQQVCGDSPDVCLRTNALYGGRLLADDIVVASAVPSAGVIELIIPVGLIGHEQNESKSAVSNFLASVKHKADKHQIAAKSKAVKSKITAAASGLWSGVKSTAARAKKSASTAAGSVSHETARSSHSRSSPDPSRRDNDGLHNADDALDFEIDDLLTSSSSFQRERSARQQEIREAEEALRLQDGSR
jgi:hypothetical protein